MAGYYGVTVNGIDLYSTKGLILLAEYSIGEASPKENWLDIPGGNGSLDISRALTGFPVFNTREISFSLFKKATDAELRELRDYLHTNFHGKTVTLSFPFDAGHYYEGLFRVGEMSQYNSGTIPITMTAQPHRLKTTETTVEETTSTAWKVLTLTNESMPVIPTITVSRATTVEFDGDQYSLAAGDHRISTIMLTAGSNTMRIKANSGNGTVTIKYREGCL